MHIYMSEPVGSYEFTTVINSYAICCFQLYGRLYSKLTLNTEAASS